MKKPYDIKNTGLGRLMPGEPLYRDRYHGILAGVCAGLAAAYGFRRLTVRILAILMLFLMPQVVIIAYLIGWLFMEVRPDQVDSHREGRSGRRRARASEGAGYDAGVAAASRVSSVAELRKRREGLEGRLRRIEACVTSRRFQLDRELRGL